MSTVYIGTGLCQTIIYTTNCSKSTHIKIAMGKYQNIILYVIDFFCTFTLQELQFKWDLSYLESDRLMFLCLFCFSICFSFDQGALFDLFVDITSFMSFLPAPILFKSIITEILNVI